jgi:hypothetical protein
MENAVDPIYKRLAVLWDTQAYWWNAETRTHISVSKEKPVFFDEDGDPENVRLMWTYNEAESQVELKWQSDAAEPRPTYLQVSIFWRTAADSTLECNYNWLFHLETESLAAILHGQPLPVQAAIGPPLWQPIDLPRLLDFLETAKTLLWRSFKDAREKLDVFRRQRTLQKSASVMIRWFSMYRRELQRHEEIEQANQLLFAGQQEETFTVLTFRDENPRELVLLWMIVLEPLPARRMVRLSIALTWPERALPPITLGTVQWTVDRIETRRLNDALRPLVIPIIERRELPEIPEQEYTLNAQLFHGSFELLLDHCDSVYRGVRNQLREAMATFSQERLTGGWRLLAPGGGGDFTPPAKRRPWSGLDVECHICGEPAVQHCSDCTLALCTDWICARVVKLM